MGWEVVSGDALILIFSCARRRSIWAWPCIHT